MFLLLKHIFEKEEIIFHRNSEKTIFIRREDIPRGWTSLEVGHPSWLDLPSGWTSLVVGHPTWLDIPIGVGHPSWLDISSGSTYLVVGHP